LGGIGRMDDGLAELHRAREIALETESWDDVARAAVNEGGALQTMARDEDALAISLEGAEIARAHGLDRAYGSFLRLNAGDALRALGRWDEADESTCARWRVSIRSGWTRGGSRNSDASWRSAARNSMRRARKRSGFRS
jgi:hypothetical protein